MSTEKMEMSGLQYCREHFGIVEADSDGPCDFAKDEFFNDEDAPCDLVDLWYYKKEGQQ